MLSMFLFCLLQAVPLAASTSIISRSATALFALPKNELPSVVSKTGLNFDVCRSTSDCQGSRRCVDSVRKKLCLATSSLCTCLNSDSESMCTSSSTCNGGESCVEILGANLCASCTFIKKGNHDPVDAGNCNVPRSASRSSSTSSSTSNANGSIRNGKGVNGDRCTSSVDCKGTRICKELNSLSLCPSASAFCNCMPILVSTCMSAAMCDQGERCVFNSKGNLCFTCAGTLPSGHVVVDDAKCVTRSSKSSSESSTTPSPASTGASASHSPRPLSKSSLGLDLPWETSTSSGGTGLNGDSCTSSSDCKGSRKCDGSVCTPTLSEARCKTSSTCDKGERCITVEGYTICLSCPLVSSAPSGTVDLVDGGKCNGDKVACVSAESLQHLSMSDLVFAEHVEADVLCDISGSCATHGHVVVYEGRPMMMSTYCEVHTQCISKRMLVNSPRLKRGLRIPSKTTGLEFTVYAAKYRTKAEEVVLGGLVRIGL